MKQKYSSNIRKQIKKRNNSDMTGENKEADTYINYAYDRRGNLTQPYNNLLGMER